MDSVKPTKQGFASIAVPHVKQTEYLIDGVPMVRVRVGATGKLGFSMMTRVAGKVKRIKLDVQDLSKSGLMGAMLEAPETANNAASTGSFVPLLTLGIPGSATTAIMLGALLSYGVQPGPRLYVDNPAVFWSVIVSMYVGNLILLFLNLPMIPYIARLLTIPRQVLTPMILYFSLVGVYLVSFNPVDLKMMVVFGVVALFFRILDYPLAPLLLGFILGAMMEENLLRALLIWDGSWAFLWERPLTLTIVALTIATAILPVLGSLKSGRFSISRLIQRQILCQALA